MTQNKKECRIYFYRYEDQKFLFSYESKGEDVVLKVKIVDGEDGIEFHLNGQPIGLTTEDFIGCEDIDDCTLVVAKHLIKDNDGQVLTAFANSYNTTLTGVIYTKRLTKDLEYDNGDMEDESWQVTLCANHDNSVTSYDYYEIPESEVDEIVSLISNRDDTLCDLLCSMFGDYVTSIGTFRYRGKTYYADDFCDAGSYGDRKFAIFKWNEEKKRYDLLAEMQ